MNIALLGYGKMGKTIEQIALERGHVILSKVNSASDNYNFKNCHVAIDFSLPEAAVKNITTALDHGVPVISGTTGWLDQYHHVADHCKAKNGAFLYASNFSLGVNIFFEINSMLARLIGNQEGYHVTLEEIHHTQKLDAPSGTAISIAEQIIAKSNYDSWTLENAKSHQIPITSKRIGAVPGTHIVTYNSEVDTIQISHEAHNRTGFALGAVIAAEWIQGKKGVFHMKDVLNIG